MSDMNPEELEQSRRLSKTLATTRAVHDRLQAGGYSESQREAAKREYLAAEQAHRTFMDQRRERPAGAVPDDVDGAARLSETAPAGAIRSDA